MRIILLLLSIIVCCTEINTVDAQRKRQEKATTLQYDTSLYHGMKWRLVGPFRGGRSAAVTGVADKPNLFYFGSTGGGVWKTTDAGNTWENISDGFFGGSIGAVAVSEWDPNVIYVGGGEKTVRGNVSSGTGLWKSVDAGKTWTFLGFEKSRHIPRIRIHPKNPDIAYAAVLGDLYKSSEERGVYKTTDGGKTWNKTLFVNQDAGIVDLVMDPNNPRILYASSWRIRRTPYSLESGGEGSSIWKSTDAGETWTELKGNSGLPDGIWGISGITVSPVNSNRVWAIIENLDGGVFRSDDAGKTWRKTNSDRSLRQRAWYYTRIYADTEDEDMVYVLNVNYHRSKDGGRTFESFNAPHGDHHDLWIDPNDPLRMIIGDDGGAQISFDGGENWTDYNTQPTAQFYRVTTDNHFPYRIYGAQQDNSTVRIAHRTDGFAIGEQDWESTAGGESAHIAVDPENNDIVYGGSYGGFLTRVNHATGEVRAINVWPDNPMGHGAKDLKYRFQWNFPIFFSPHNPDKLYAASNYLHVTYNEGQSWETISPDLTVGDTSKLGSSGGPITKDNTSVEYYATIFAAAESPLEEGVIWTGSDDGKIHITTNGGSDWKDVTPAGMPEWMMINSIDPHPTVKGGAYVAGTRYKLGDYTPYLYKTTDYGASWTRITNGIPSEHFTRVVRADPARPGLLYAGTEYGMYVSFDDGASWESFQLNLPLVPITDLAVKNNNLIAATQGRSFWMIDDLTVLHQLNDQSANAESILFKPMDAYRMDGRGGRATRTRGANHPGGVLVHYYLKDTAQTDTVRIEFLEKSGKLIAAYSTHPDKKAKENKLAATPGLNSMSWDMRYPGGDDFEGMILWWSSLSGPKALPGDYTVRMSHNGNVQDQTFTVVKDPRSGATMADLQLQFTFLNEVVEKISETNNTIGEIRKVRAQINDVKSRMEGEEFADIRKKADDILKEMKGIEESLYQTKNRSRQDPLNYPIRLNNKLAHLNSLEGLGDSRPTDQAVAFKKEVTAMIDEQLDKFEKIKETDIPELNRMVKTKQVDAIKIE